MEERWADIKGYEGIYQVSSAGRFRSIDRIRQDGRIPKGQIKVRNGGHNDFTSVSRIGNCHDNAVLKSFFGHLKSEAFYSQGLIKISKKIVRKIVLEYIHYYNCVRIQEK